MILTIAFILLSAIILWFVIGSKGQWHLKAVCIALTLYFSLSLSKSLHDVAGWPSGERLPDKFEIHWGLVEEPDKSTGKKTSCTDLRTSSHKPIPPESIQYPIQEITTKR